MDILFIYYKNTLDLEIMGPMIISSVLKKAGFPVEFIDADYNLIKKRLLLSGGNCILAYSMQSAFYGKFLSLNRKIKVNFPDTISLFGGPHPTIFPQMIEEEGVDGVCIGEGEYAMLELVKNLSEKKPFTNIKNWWIKQDGKIFKNPLRPLIEDLDSLPFADRSYFSEYMPSKVGKAVVITSRGCPHNCSFCFNSAYNRIYNLPSGKIRRRSADNIIEEIRRLENKFILKHILFLDDNFMLSRAWLEDFLYKYKKEIGLPFSCFARPDFIEQDIVRLFKDSGCVGICMGIECGSNYIRNAILKKGIVTKDIVKATRIIKNERIYLRTTNILGIPGSSLKDDFETLKLNIKCKPDYARAGILSIYPNVDIYSLAKKHNLICDGFESITQAGRNYLKRNYNNRRERRKLENFSCLFSIITYFPFLLPLLKFLIELPLTIVYSNLSSAFSFYQFYLHKKPRVNEGIFVKRILGSRKIIREAMIIILSRVFKRLTTALRNNVD